MRNSCPTKEGKWAISCIALIRCQARRLQQLLLQYYWNPDETTTKFSTLKKTQLLRSQNVFKLHYIARKLTRIYWTSNFQMTKKKTQQQQHHITYILGSVLITVSRMPASAEVRNSTILRGGRGKKKKKTTTTSDLRKEKREGKKKKKKNQNKKIFIVGRRVRPTCWCCSSSSTWSMTTNCCNSTTDSAAACYYCWLLSATVWHHVINKQAHCEEWKENLSSREKRKRRRRRTREKKTGKKARVGSSPDRPWCDLALHQQLANKKERKKERKNGQDKYSSSSSSSSSFLPGKMQPVRDEHKPKFVQVSLLMSVVLLPPPPPSWAERDAVLCCSSSLLPACRRHHRLLRLSRTCACLSVCLSLFLTLDRSSS